MGKKHHYYNWRKKEKITQGNTNRTAIRLDIPRYNLPTLIILQYPPCCTLKFRSCRKEWPGLYAWAQKECGPLLELVYLLEFLHIQDSNYFVSLLNKHQITHCATEVLPLLTFGINNHFINSFQIICQIITISYGRRGCTKRVCSYYMDGDWGTLCLHPVE